jgi:CRISPR/Cas system-associated exonuclease Cas4 (RecB family)
MKPALYKPVILKKEVDDTHYYFVDGVYFPGITTILSETLPTPMALKNWLGEVGNEVANRKLNAAGEKGTLIHNTCESLLKGEKVNLVETFPAKNKFDIANAEKDKKCVIGFINWINEVQPILKKHSDIEFTIASKDGYAGTVDLFCYIKNKKGKEEPWIIDFKTSASVYDSHKFQITAYQKAYEEMTGIKAKRGILHLNPRTKAGWSFYDKIEIKKKDVTYSDVKTVMNMYKVLNGGQIKEPRLKSVYPETVKLYE